MRGNWTSRVSRANEISAAKLQPDEEARLTEDLQRAGNASRLLEFSQEALDLLGEQEDSLLRQAGALGRTLQALQRLDSSAGEVARLS